MKRCNKCNLTVTGDRKLCPLCQNVLTGESGGEPEPFPYIPTVYHEFSLFFKVIMLISIIAGVAAVAVNLMIPQSGWWSLFVLLGLGCAWLSVSLAVRKRRNIMKNATYQVALISLCAVLWDALTGWHGWSIDYVVPIICCAAMMTLSILAKTLHLPASDFLIYLCITALFGIVPLLFYLTGILHVIYPSIICVAGSIITLSALLVFQGGEMAAELRRRLHL